MGHCADTGHTGDTVRVKVGTRVGRIGVEQGERNRGEG